jgi:hypothetical protein
VKAYYIIGVVTLVTWFVESTGLPAAAFPYAAGLIVFAFALVFSFLAHRVEHGSSSFRETALIASVAAILSAMGSVTWLEVWPESHVSLATGVPLVGAITLAYFGKPLVKVVFSVVKHYGVEKLGGKLGGKDKK